MSEKKQMTHAEALALAKELVSKMTVEERAFQLSYRAPAIPHLGIPEYPPRRRPVGHRHYVPPGHCSGGHL